MMPGADQKLASHRGLALVSGGSGEIGTAICERLHDQGWGLAIGYTSRNRAEAFARGSIQSMRLPERSHLTLMT